MKCPKCKSMNPDNAEYCIHCQSKLTEQKKILSKICPECGKENDSDAIYCIKCQSKLAEKKSKNFIALYLILGFLIVSFIGFKIVISSPEYRLNDAVKSNNTEKLALILTSNSDLLEKSKYKEKYISFIKSCTNDYIDEIKDYDTVLSDFQKFSDVNSYTLDEDILKITTENLFEIDLIHTSRIAFEDAEKAFSEKDYQSAEIKYSEVVSEDKKYYVASQSKLKEISDLKESYIIESNEKLLDNNFDDSIQILLESLTYFSYDEKYNNLYYNKIVDNVCKESDFLIKQDKYFSSQKETGAFNLIYSYLSEKQYSDNKALKSKLNEIVKKSEASQISYAEKSLSLTNKNDVIDRYAKRVAEDYYKDNSIQDDNSYILNLCQNSNEIQSLLNNIPGEKQVSVTLVSGLAVTAEDFSKISKERLNSYYKYKWNYTGIGRYYNEKDMNFSWAVIIIYESE